MRQQSAARLVLAFHGDQSDRRSVPVCELAARDDSHPRVPINRPVLTERVTLTRNRR